MTAFVLDASAVLALFWQEPGWERVTEVLEGNDHAISTVNLAELASKFVDAGLPQDEIQSIVAALRLNARPLDPPLALEVGQLRAATRRLGLSLGDRSCLALARQLNATALTADRPWVQIGPTLSVAIECIRD